MTSKNLQILNGALCKATLCLGLNNEPYMQYLARRKGVIKQKGKVSAYLDGTFEGGTTQVGVSASHTEINNLRF